MCPDDDDYVLVNRNDITHVVLDEGAEEPTAASSTGGAAAAAEEPTAASSTGGAAAAVDAAVTPKPKPKIVSRPQAGNGQNYFTMLHKWAGRSAGGFGRPAGYRGNGEGMPTATYVL